MQPSEIKVTLQDLNPEQGSFFLSKMGREIRIMPVSNGDFEWMRVTFGQDLEKVFREMRAFDLCRIIVRIMHPEDQKLFEAQDRVVLDEGTGEKRTMRLGGAKLLQELVSGPKEVLGIYEALVKTIGVSKALIDQVEAEEKKRAEELKAKADGSPQQSTGPASSTPSPASTAGPLTA